MNVSAELLAFLKTVPVFEGLENRSLRHIIPMLHSDSFAAGAPIFSEGEMGRTMYILEDGEVEVFRTSSSADRISIVKLKAGECIGEMALVELQPRSATVVATKPVTALSITNLDLYELYRVDNYAYVIVLQNICRMISRRLRKADGRIAEFLAALNAAERESTQSKVKALRARAKRPRRGS